MGWDGMEGMKEEWNGVEWNEGWMGWDGMGWDGMDGIE